MSIKQIIVGTRNYTTQSRANEEPTPEQYKRYYICKSCELAINSTFFKIIVDKHLTDISGKKCKQCGCSLSLKIRSNSKCPTNKW